MAKKAIYGKHESIVTYEYEILNGNYSTEYSVSTKNGSGYKKRIPTYTYSLDANGNAVWSVYSEVVLSVTSGEGSWAESGWCRDSGGSPIYKSLTSAVCLGRDEGNNNNLFVLRFNKRFTGNKLERVEKGTYIADIIADYNSLPENGRHSDGYWYVYIKMASDLKGNDTGLWRDIPTGWINDSGIWKPQSELKCNVSGIFK